jgi:hypothetical protein
MWRGNDAAATGYHCDRPDFMGGKVMQRTYQSCVEGILSTNGTEPFHLFGGGTALSELLKIYDFF